MFALSRTNPPSPPLLRLTEETYIALLQNTITLDDFSPNDLFPLFRTWFNRLICDDRKDIAQDLVYRFDPNSLRKLVCEDLSEDVFLIVSQRLKTFVLADDFLDWSEISSPTLTALVRFGLPAVATDTAVQCRLADFVLKQFSNVPSFASVLAFLDFSQLSHHQIKSLFQLIPFPDTKFGHENVGTVINFFVEVDQSLTSFKKTLL
jgi:hypothetical protein